MLPCPVCGNLRDAHGVCRNCQRNEWEGRRSGRRYQKRPERQELPEIPRTRSKIGSKRRGRSPKPPGKNVRVTSTSSPPKIRRSRSGAFVRTIAYSHQLRRGVNSLLADVYDEPCLVSDLLRSRGLANRQIERLQERHLPQFLLRLVRAWYVDWLRFLDSEDAQLLVRWYSLDGKEPQRQKGGNLGRDNRKAEIKVNAILTELRKQSRQIRLSAIAVREANRILQHSPENL